MKEPPWNDCDSPGSKDDENRKPGNDWPVWWVIVLVFFVVFGVVLAVLNHASEKPGSPQSLVAAAFNRPITAKEWRPGMGPEPLIYHPAAFKTVAAPGKWQPLYVCPWHGATTPRLDAYGQPHCPTCNQIMVTNK